MEDENYIKDIHDMSQKIIKIKNGKSNKDRLGIITSKLKKESNSEEILKNRDVKLQEIRWNVNLLQTKEVKKLNEDFLFNNSEKFDKIIESKQTKFKETNYVEENCFKVFYNKLKSYNSMNYKGQIKYLTPSFDFITASKENNMIPYPNGLIKRKGLLNSLELK
jgi:hypothetical protein